MHPSSPHAFHMLRFCHSPSLFKICIYGRELTTEAESKKIIQLRNLHKNPGDICYITINIQGPSDKLKLSQKDIKTLIKLLEDNPRINLQRRKTMAIIRDSAAGC
jgi:hypothetical protein